MSQPDLFHSFTKINHKRPYRAISAALASSSAAGKTVLVTGGSQGIGLNIAGAFAAAGAAHVVLLARHEDRLAEAKSSLRAKHPSTKFDTFRADITDLERTKEVFTLFPDPDILVLNAAYLHRSQPVMEVPLDNVRKSFEVNVLGNMAFVQAYLSPLVHASGGKPSEERQRPETKQRMILNIITSSAQLHNPGMSAYGSSKEAFIHLLGHVQNEYSDRGLHVRNLHPGHIYTTLLEDHGFARDFWDWDSSKFSLSTSARTLVEGEILPLFRDAWQSRFYSRKIELTRIQLSSLALLRSGSLLMRQVFWTDAASGRNGTSMSSKQEPMKSNLVHIY